MIERIQQRLGDDARFVEGVYPYSVLENPLTEGRDGSWLWRQLERLQNRRVPVIPQLINLYNALQVLVSADRRYGPIFNLGIAREVWKLLREAGYRHGSGDPVVLLGWSGGVQICVGMAWYLADLKIPVYVLSLAGVISSDPGLDRIRHLWHIEGTRDHVPQLGQVIFPSRWPLFPESSWNRARREGRITTQEVGPWRHASSPTYLSRRRQPNGIVPVDQSADALIEPLIAAGLIRRRLPFTDGRKLLEGGLDAQARGLDELRDELEPGMAFEELDPVADGQPEEAEERSSSAGSDLNPTPIRALANPDQTAVDTLQNESFSGGCYGTVTLRLTP